MKNMLVLFVLMSFFLAPAFCQTITKDYLRNMLTHSDSPESIEEARSLAIANPQILESIIFTPKEDLDNSIARHNSLVYLCECAQTGKITADYFFDISLRLIKNISQYSFPEQVDEELLAFRGIVFSYGFDPIRKVVYVNIFSNFKAFLTALEKMVQYNQISNLGIYNSLKTKITKAKEVLEKQRERGKKPAINKINAAINEAEAQRGKHLTENGFQIFVGYCKNLTEQIKNTTF
jgi:hypothetical protein